MSTPQIIQPSEPVRLNQGDKMIDVYLGQAVKKYGISMKSFHNADDVQVFLNRTVQTEKQSKVYATIEIIMDGRCRTLEVAKVFKR